VLRRNCVPSGINAGSGTADAGNQSCLDGDEIRDLQVEETNRAKDIIEDFMIAANDVTALFLQGNIYHP